MKLKYTIELAAKSSGNKQRIAYLESDGQRLTAIQKAALQKFIRDSIGPSIKLVGIARNGSSNKAGGPSKTRVPSKLVSYYCSNLEKTFRDPRAFKRVFSELESNPELKSQDVIAIAKKFALTTATSKKKALKAIWVRHSLLMESRAKEASRDGRSAA